MNDVIVRELIVSGLIEDVKVVKEIIGSVGTSIAMCAIAVNPLDIIK